MNTNIILGDLQNYVQRNYGVNLKITNEFKNALDNLTTLVSDLNGSSIKKLKNMCTSSSNKKSSKGASKKNSNLNKTQIKLKLKLIQQNHNIL